MKQITAIIIFVWVLSGCKKKEEETHSAPFIDFTINNTFKTNPDTVAFFASSGTEGTTFEWGFDDGTAKETGNSVSHIFDIGYYTVTLNGTANGQTSSVQHGVNASPYIRISVSGVRVTRIPSKKSNGDNWDTDGTGPDIYCKVSVPNYSQTTSIVSDVITGNVNIASDFPVNAMMVNSIDKFIRIELMDFDDQALSNEEIESITIENGVVSLMKNTLPYQTSLTFTGEKATVELIFSWLN